MKTHSGSCHCGAIKFQIKSEISVLTTCDCSICVKKNALMTKVHADNFELLSGEKELTEYNWNTKIARHFFCSVCGIYTFHRKRAAPDYYGVNIFCLDDFDPKSVPVQATEGLSMSVVEEGARDVWLGPRGE